MPRLPTELVLTHKRLPVLSGELADDYVEVVETVPEVSPFGPRTADEALVIKQVLELTRHLAAQDELAGLERVAVGAAVQLTRCERAHCLFFDAESQVLWSEQPGRSGDITSGLVMIAARSGQPRLVKCAGDDPGYEPLADDPPGRGNEQLLVQPVIGDRGQVQAVLVAVRGRGHAEFSARERAALAAFARHAAPMLQQFSLGQEALAVIEESATPAARIYRSEAVEASRHRAERGDVVRVSPGWTRGAYWALLVLLIGAGAFLWFGKVDRYSGGPAFVRIASRSEVTAPVGGSVVAAEVAAGQRVARGQLLARLYDADAAAELRRIEQQLDARIIDVMRNPADDAARKAAAALTADKERAEARLEERAIRAPHAGTVSDVRIRTGQHLNPGDTVMSVVGDDESLSIVALLPGADGPQLSRGQTLRLELSGYQYAYQDLPLEFVGKEVIGPAEARRYLGAQLADTVPLRGPVVVVRARLPEPTFEADGKTYAFRDGMTGRAEVRMRSERILTTLVPGLKGL